MKKFFFLLLLFIVGVVSEDLIQRNASNIPKSRQKRSYICLFGLTYLLQAALFSAFIDYRNKDPLEVGDTEDGSLKDGVLRGLSSLTNLTAFQVYCEEVDLIVFTSAVRLKKAEITYTWIYDMIFEIEGTVGAKIEEINVEFLVHLNTSTMEFQVKTLTVSKLEGFEVKFTGLGPMNPVIRRTMTVFYWLRKGNAKEKLQSRIRDGLQSKLNDIADSLSVLALLNVFMDYQRKSEK